MNRKCLMISEEINQSERADDRTLAQVRMAHAGLTAPVN
jgi:hypothetical protein